MMASQGKAITVLSKTRVRPVIINAIPVFVQKGQPIDAILVHRPVYCNEVFILLVQF
jgi:hypothetical protein